MKKSYAINNLKLQSILYFIQVIFVDNYSQKCFGEDITARDLGVIIPKSYFKYKQFGGINISLDYINIEGFDKNKIKEKHKRDINDIIDELAKFTASDLIKIIEKQTPYKKAFTDYQDKIIKIEDIKEYFKKFNRGIKK